MGWMLAIFAAVPFVPELGGAPPRPPRLPVEARLRRPLPTVGATPFVPTEFLRLRSDGTDQVGSVCTSQSASGMELRADGVTIHTRGNIVFLRHASPLKNVEATEWSSPGLAEAMAVAVTGGLALPAAVSRYGRKVPVECRPVSRQMLETLRSDCRHERSTLWCIQLQAVYFGADDRQVRWMLQQELALRTQSLRDAWHRVGQPAGFEVTTLLDGSRTRFTIRNSSSTAATFDTTSCGAIDADGVPFHAHFTAASPVLAPNEVKELWLQFSEPDHADAPAWPLFVGLGKTCEHGFVIVQ